MTVAEDIKELIDQIETGDYSWDTLDALESLVREYLLTKDNELLDKEEN